MSSEREPVMGRIYPNRMRWRRTRMEASSPFWRCFAGGLLLGAVLWMLVGCSQDDLVQKFSSPEEQATARGYIDLLRAGKFDELEKAADSSIRGPNLHDTLAKMAALVPSQEPKSIRLVGAQRFHAPGATTVNTTFEYNYGEKWLLANVAVQDKNGAKTIVGFNINPITQSLESQNRFTLIGKRPAQYLVLAAAISAVLITLCSLVLCARTKLPGKKWLWIPFIALGFGKIAVNWTTGEWSVAPFFVQLLSASAFAPLHGPWTIAVALPVGALIFLIYRRSLLVAKAES